MVRILHRVELNESSNMQRDDSHVSTQVDKDIRKGLGDSRSAKDLPDPRRQTLGLKRNWGKADGEEGMTPREKLKLINRTARVKRREEMIGAQSQGRSGHSKEFRKGWKGSILEPERKSLEKAHGLRVNPGGSTHITTRGVKKERGAKPLAGEVRGEEAAMSGSPGEGGNVTRNLIARKKPTPNPEGVKVTPARPPFRSHDENIKDMYSLGKSYANPSRADKVRPPKPKIRQSQKIER